MKVVGTMFFKDKKLLIDKPKKGKLFIAEASRIPGQPPFRLIARFGDSAGFAREIRDSKKPEPNFHSCAALGWHAKAEESLARAL